MYPGFQIFFFFVSAKRAYVSALKAESLVRNLDTYKQKTLWLPGLKALNGILNIVNRTCDVQKAQGKHPVTKAFTSFGERGRRGASLYC